MFKKKKEINIEDDSQEDNIYSSYMHNDESKDSSLEKVHENDNDLEESHEIKNIENQKNNNSENHYVYKEKEYNTNTLENNTVVTRASKISRFILIGFYLLVIVIGVMAFFMIRSNKYEFYLKQDSVFIDSGSTYQIELIPKDGRYFDYLNYSYSIADESIATVDEYGTVTAIGTGTTTLKISLKPGFINSKTMKIIAEDINIESINLGVYKDDKFVLADYLELGVDQSITLKPILNNRDDLNVSATFKSSNPNIATVDSFGNVTAKNNGTVTIIGTVNGVDSEITINVKGGRKPQIIKPTSKPSWTSAPNPINPIDKTPKPVNVPTNKPTPMAIQKISFQVNNISVKKGSTAQLSPIITPVELSSSTLTWKSNNESIVTVNNSGLITGLNTGTATITVTTNNGLTASCNINVTTNEVKTTSISLNKTSISMDIKNTYQLIATISPSTATVRKLIWTSDNDSVATVNQNGLVTGVSSGKATIMVTSSDGKAVARCSVTVKNVTTPKPTVKPTDSPKPTASSGSSGKVTKVSLGVASQITKYVGDELQLLAAVEPTSITNYTVTWKSSDTNKATVSNGLVKMKASGTVEITAEVNGVKGKVTIVIKEKTTTTPPPATAPKGSQFTGTAASYISIDKTSLTVTKGGTATFKIKLKDATGTVYVKQNDKSIVDLELPTSSVGICNDEQMCFLDALTKEDEITITVKGLKAGQTYININIDNIVLAADDSEINGSAKVGILVK